MASTVDSPAHRFDARFGFLGAGVQARRIRRTRPVCGEVRLVALCKPCRNAGAGSIRRQDWMTVFFRGPHAATELHFFSGRRQFTAFELGFAIR